MEAAGGLRTARYSRPGGGRDGLGVEHGNRRYAGRESVVVVRERWTAGWSRSERPISPCLTEAGHPDTREGGNGPFWAYLVRLWGFWPGSPFRWDERRPRYPIRGRLILGWSGRAGSRLAVVEYGVYPPRPRLFAFREPIQRGVASAPVIRLDRSWQVVGEAGEDTGDGFQVSGALP